MPFPDYYIANVAFALAEAIVAHPRPMTIAGVSPRSFGYTLFNNLEEAGAKLLKTDLQEHESFEDARRISFPDRLTRRTIWSRCSRSATQSPAPGFLGSTSSDIADGRSPLLFRPTSRKLELAER